MIQPFLDYQDYEPGRTFRTRGRTVTEADIVAFAGLTGDFYELHTVEEFAQRTRFGGRVAHGLLTLSQAVGLVMLSGVHSDCVIALLGIDRMRAQEPVRPGDTISVQVTVAERRETRHADRGIVTLDYMVFNQRDEQVMTFSVTTMVRRAVQT
jgi:3-hydroxybutyryl-CoA dehydratase